MNILKEIVQDYGTNPDDWPVEAQREAVAELYEQDTRGFWIGDALSDWASDKKNRDKLIDALKLDKPIRHAALGILMEQILVLFPLSHLQRVAEQHEANWIARAS